MLSAGVDNQPWTPVTARLLQFIVGAAFGLTAFVAARFFGQRRDTMADGSQVAWCVSTLTCSKIASLRSVFWFRQIRLDLTPVLCFARLLFFCLFCGEALGSARKVLCF